MWRRKKIMFIQNDMKCNKKFWSWSFRRIVILRNNNNNYCHVLFLYTLAAHRVCFPRDHHHKDAEICSLKMASSFPSPPERVNARARCNLRALIAITSAKRSFFSLILRGDNVMFFWLICAREAVSSCDQRYYNARISSTWWRVDYKLRSCFRCALTLITAWSIAEVVLIASVWLRSGSVTQLHSTRFYSSKYPSRICSFSRLWVSFLYLLSLGCHWVKIAYIPYK